MSTVPVIAPRLRRLIPGKLLVSLTVLLGIAVFPAVSQSLDQQTCGTPLVNAVQSQLDQGNSFAQKRFSGIKEKLFKAKTLQKGLRLISRANLQRLQKKLNPLKPKEQQLVEYIRKNELPSIHRMIRRKDGQWPSDREPFNESFRILKNVLSDGLLAPAVRKEESQETPGIEQALYTANHCIFTSVGPPEGIPTYGTVQVEIDRNVDFAWGSIYSGWTFIQYYPRNDQDNYQPKPDDATSYNKMWFSEFVFTNDHWEPAFAYYVIKGLRNGRTFSNRTIKNPDTLLSKILTRFKRKNAKDAYELINDHRLAYLEGHYPERIPLKHFNEIIVRKQDQSLIEKLGITSPLITFE